MKHEELVVLSTFYAGGRTGCAAIKFSLCSNRLHKVVRVPPLRGFPNYKNRAACFERNPHTLP